MRTYEIPTDPKLANIVIAYEDNLVLSIPKVESNADYQRYLRWVENPETEQSTPSVIDEAEAK